MSERVYRLILGSGLMILLYFKLDLFVYAYIGLLFFEGLTNLRIPGLVSKLRGAGASDTECSACKINFEAERVLRIMVGLMLIGTFVLFPEQTWFFPWFVGFMLTLAGITNLCPMLMSLKWVGFK